MLKQRENENKYRHSHTHTHTHTHNQKQALPGDVSQNMFELAKDAYSLEVESLFVRGESPLIAPEGYAVLGLSEEEGEKVFKRVKRSYEGEREMVGGGEGGEGMYIDTHTYIYTHTHTHTHTHTEAKI